MLFTSKYHKLTSNPRKVSNQPTSLEIQIADSYPTPLKRVAHLTTKMTPVATEFLPGPNPGDCFWQSEKNELSDIRSTETLPEHSDILIVGGGYAGISTAYHLIKDPSYNGQTITILEARSVCSGATGRNGGHLRPDLYGHIPTYIDRAGVDAGVEIAEFEIAHVHAIKKIVEDEKIDCDFSLTRTIDVWCNEESAKKAKEVYDQMSARSLAYLSDVIFHTGKGVEGVGRFRPILSYVLTFTSDMRSKRCKGMCFIHSRNYLALQVYTASHQTTPRFWKCQHPDFHTSKVDQSRCRGKFRHHHPTRNDKSIKSSTCEQRICISSPTTVQKEHRSLQRNMLSHHRPRRHHRTSSEQLLHQSHLR